MYPKRHKNNAIERAALAERQRRSRENKRLQQDAIFENPELGTDKVWADNLALLSADERDNLLVIQKDTIEMIGFIEHCLKLLEAGTPPSYLDLTYEDARKMKLSRGTYKYSLSKRDIAEIYITIGRNNPIVRGDESVQLGKDEQRWMLLIGDREYNLFGLITRLSEDLYQKFIRKIAEYLRDLPTGVEDENFDSTLAADVIRESGIDLGTAQAAESFSDLLTGEQSNLVTTPVSISNQIQDVSAFEQNRDAMRRELQRLTGRGW